jgi:hypothetical protein
MSDKPHDKMTHDEILREHGARYAQMSPGERADKIIAYNIEDLEATWEVFQWLRRKM